MKKLVHNRTFAAAICIVLALILSFVIAPLLSRSSADAIEVPRLKSDIKQGTEITAAELETVKIAAAQIPAGVLTNPNDIIGKSAAAYLYAGDYLTGAKLQGDSGSASDVLSNLDGNKVAVSIRIDQFAAGLSGKLENGDVISIIVVDHEAKAFLPEELKYVKVITTTTSNGIDQDNIIKNEDGSYVIPSTVTVLVNYRQALALAEYDFDSTLTVALVCRGSAAEAAQFLAEQDNWFDTHKAVTDHG